MLVVDKLTGLRVNHMRATLDESFHPTNNTNSDCTSRMLGVIVKSMRDWRDEMLNKKEPFGICLFWEHLVLGISVPTRIRSGCGDACQIMTQLSHP